jgi:Cu2+-containing amine oxidase
VRRGRRLVISFIMTAVNYEYCFYWYLYQVQYTRAQYATAACAALQPQNPRPN